MTNPIINPNIGGQSESMAASSAMIVSGLNKELKTNKSKVVTNDPKVNLEQLEKQIQKLTATVSIDEINKRQEEYLTKKQSHKQINKKAKETKTIEKPFDWINNKKSYNPFINWLIEFQRKVLQKILYYALQPEIDDLIKLADELKIDVTSWNLEKFSVNQSGQIILPSNLSDSERILLLLKEEFKVLEIGELLEDNLIHIIIIKLRKKNIINYLLKYKVTWQQINELKTQARQIAWLKEITQLKASHLKRVFCGSRRDFNYYSKAISNHTKKIRKIGLTISGQSFDWINTKLEKLAHDTAHYKLELLYSMQKLAPNKDREKEIKWLEHL